ncbi:MAG: ABC transporter ATP-binding protein [Eubacterium sp.]|nr:ABC transporter ATP-binding protein [Eubacterium sp.]
MPEIANDFFNDFMPKYSDIIDNGIRKGDMGVVYSKTFVLILLALVGMTAAISAQYFAARAATGFATELRLALFKKIQSFSYSEIDKTGTSTLINRLTTDVNQAQNGVNMVLRLFLRSPFIVAGAVVMALFIDVKAGLIFLAVVALLSAVVWVIMKITVPKYKEVQQTLDNVTLLTRENLNGARVIRAFTSEENELKKFEEKNEWLAHLQRVAGRISAIMNPATYVIVNLGIIALIYYGALRVNSSHLSQGSVVALYNYMSQILVELVKFANLIVTVTKGFASSSRLAAVLDMQNTLEKNNNSGIKNSHAVCFENVSLKYKGAGEESLKNISFYADRGEVIGIIGSTGSGKSSLVNLIPHYYDSSKGVVFVNGRDVKSYETKELRNIIGFAEQKAALFSGTVRDNMLWGNKNASDEEIISALKIAQIYESLQEKEGLETVIEQGGANLSGGQKQRLSVARAIVKNPQIIILDDSASALDFATEKAMRNAVLALDYKPTLFIVSQRASSMLCADRIIVLDDGECVGIGNNEELLSSCEVYREIYYSQFEKEDSDEQ